MVIVYCFYSQQVNRHIVDASHVFLENEVIAERLDAVEALQFRLLGDEEGNASFFQALTGATGCLAGYSGKTRGTVSGHGSVG